ncbi:MAG TPA: MlaE family lipid ABC transporter permease subunit [Terriglobales bacterium]|nr:MlaE family lipid ABC transporter permease subunit [Terriglobales bacterium]
MASATDWVSTTREGTEAIWSLRGDWTIHNAQAIDRQLQGQIKLNGKDAGQPRKIDLDLSNLASLDSAGAWLLTRLARDCRAAGTEVGLLHIQPRMQGLLQRVIDAAPDNKAPEPPRRNLGDWVAQIGKAVIDIGDQTLDLLAFFGALAQVTMRAIVRPRHLRMNSIVSHIEQTGLNAMPIVGLISFLVGVVLAYQGADQLARFGAQVFTVNMVGISVLREMGILLTAIVVAGRSGSAFTAQIGTMKVNEEVDALETMGLNPIEVLVLPRVLALVISLPLLTFFADIMGLLGGGLMCVLLVDMSFQQYLMLLRQAITVSQFGVGMIKAPVFALLIALIGCFEGMRVTGSAESVGKLTTKSVVEGIFLVIVFDAFFSILFSMLGV